MTRVLLILCFVVVLSSTCFSQDTSATETGDDGALANALNFRL